MRDLERVKFWAWSLKSFGFGVTECVEHFEMLSLFDKPFELLHSKLQSVENYIFLEKS